MERYCPEHLFNRFFILIWVEAFALQMGQNIFNNLITSYMQSLGYSNTFAGLLAVPYMVFAFAGRFYSGYLSDHKSRRLGMVLGCAIFTVGAVIYSIPMLAVPVILMLFRGIHGFGYAAGSTAYSAALVDVTPKAKLSLGVGVNWTAQGAAQLIGGIVCTVLVFGSNYRPVFSAAVVFTLAGTIAAVLCRYERGCSPQQKNNTAQRNRLCMADIIEPGALPYALVVLVYYLGIAVCSFYTVALSEQRGISGGSMFFSTAAVGMILANLLLVRAADRFGRWKVMLPVVAAAVCCDLLLISMNSFSILMVSGLLFGISIGAMPVFQSAAVEKLPRERCGAGTGTLFLAMDISMGIGPIVWGAVIDRSGYIAAFSGAVVFLIIAGLIMIPVLKGGRDKQ